MNRDDLTITIEGHAASGARAGMRQLLALAIVNLGGKPRCDGPLVSGFDLHGAAILIRLVEPARRRKTTRKRRRR